MVTLVAGGDSNPLAERFPNAHVSDLNRFLKARDGNVEKAAAMYQAHLDWKASLPDVKQAAWKELVKGKIYMRGKCKQGRQIVVWKTRLNDPKERDIDEARWMATYWAIKIDQICRESDDPEAKITMIADRTENILDLDLIKDNFPERLGVCYIVPTGVLYRGVWKIVSMFLDPETSKKVKMLDCCESLHEFISEDNIPAHMGGTDSWEFDAERDCDDLKPLN